MLALALAAYSVALPPPTQSALIREGDPDPGAQDPSAHPGQIVLGFQHVDVNSTGGYACMYATRDSAGNVVHRIWGSFTEGPGTVLRSPSTIGNVTQIDLGIRAPYTNRESFGISSSSLAYAAVVIDPMTQQTVTSVWVDDSPVALPGTAIPGAGGDFKDSFRVGISEPATPHFTALVTWPQGPHVDRTGFFQGSPPDPLYLAGETYGPPSLVEPVGQQYGTHWTAVSDLGLHNIALMRGASASNMIAIDGSVLSIEGTYVCCANLLPADWLFGPSGRWFPREGKIIDSRQYAFTSRSELGHSEVWFLVRNGRPAAREGDVWDGRVLDGRPLAIALGQQGALAVIWGQPTPPNTPLNATLFVEGRAVLGTGDAVDWDGDGQIDPGFVVSGFPGTLAMGSDGTIYVHAEVRNGPVRREALLKIAGHQVGDVYCSATQTASGSSASIWGSGSASIAANDLRLHASGLPASAFAMFIASQNQGFTPNAGNSAGNLCLSSPIGRLVGGVVLNSGENGVVEADVDWGNIPQPTGTVAAVVGQTWNFQAWTRDRLPNGVGTSNYSTALSVVAE